MPVMKMARLKLKIAKTSIAAAQHFMSLSAAAALIFDGVSVRVERRLARGGTRGPASCSRLLGVGDSKDARELVYQHLLITPACHVAIVPPRVVSAPASSLRYLTRRPNVTSSSRGDLEFSTRVRANDRVRARVRAKARVRATVGLGLGLRLGIRSG